MTTVTSFPLETVPLEVAIADFLPGPPAGFRQAFDSSTTDSDPGNGEFRLNHATLASATAAYLDNLDAFGSTVSAIIDTYDDSTNANKGRLRFEKSTDPTVFAEYTVTGSVVDGTGYRKVTLTHIASNGTFTAADVFSIGFFASGNAGVDGEDGTGTGDVKAASAFSNDNRLIRSDGTDKGVQASAVTVDDSGNMSGVGTLATSGAISAGTTIELGHASDTTLSRVSAGVVAIEGSNILMDSNIGASVQAYDAQLSSLIRQNSQNAAYTLVLTDGGKHILHPSTDNNARTFTIPANASVAFPIGTVVTFVNMINTVTIAITSDALILSPGGSTGSRTLAANGVATVLKISSTTWIISGTGLT